MKSEADDKFYILKKLDDLIPKLLKEYGLNETPNGAHWVKMKQFVEKVDNPEAFLSDDYLSHKKKLGIPIPSDKLFDFFKDLEDKGSDKLWPLLASDPTGKGGAADFHYLQTATKSPLTLLPNLPDGVPAAVWALRYCMIENNGPAKVWSNTLQVTVSTVVNKPSET